jgi:GntR family transcriptional regulator/MocR family aminotransferase
MAPVRRPWELVVDLDRRPDLPTFLQIARALAGDIHRGRLKPGDPLPGSRKLAGSLRVHRNTVLAALGELEAEGWLEAVPGKGTFVARGVAAGRRGPAPPRGPRAQTPLPFPIPETPAAYRPPNLREGTLNLSNGAPDVRLVPSRSIGRALRRVLALRGPELLAYGEPDGHPALRAALASMLASLRGLAASPEDVLVTRGSQMALNLVARALLRKGDVVAVEAFGYRPAWEAFRSAGATVVPVPVDGEGLDVAALERLARRTPLRAAYVTPHHQYPTTVTLKAARRLALLDLARTHRFVVVEDDYDHEFHYEGRPVLPLASAAPPGLVVYIGTLSKILAPGLRIGYVVASQVLLGSLSALRSLLDIQGDQATEAAVASLIEDGELQRHVARVRRVYARRREILASSLRRAFGEGASFSLAPGGMALWVRFDMPVDVEAWARRSLRHGVSWYTGKRYAFDGRAAPFGRFSFAWLGEDELTEAVRRLAAACPQATRRGARN